MKEKLKQFLSHRPKRHIFDAGCIPAAVVLPLFYKNGEYHILFTKRTETVKDHKGQISFPGGRGETEDRTTLRTALRECTEEIGLPSDKVEILGELDDFLTKTTSYIVSAYVGVIPYPCDFKIDRAEIEHLIEVPISALLDPACQQEEVEINRGEKMTAYCYNYQGKIIWGATARILNQFLKIWIQVNGNHPTK